MPLRPGDPCSAPPPGIPTDHEERVEAIYVGPAPPNVIGEGEVGRDEPVKIPRVVVRYEGEDYVVEASKVEAAPAPEATPRRGRGRGRAAARCSP